MTLDRWLTVAFGVVGLVGIIATWYFSRYYYKRSDKQRTPTFAVSAQRKTLAHPDLRKVSGVSLLDTSTGSDNVGSKGITEVEVYFWNSGGLPILADEVLEQFMIGVDAPILDVSVPKISREVVDFRVGYADDSVPALSLSFSVLEPGDGATIRIVYDGPEKTDILFHGACLGAPRPKVLPSNPIYSVPVPRRFRGMLLLLLMLAVPLTLAGLIEGAGRLITTLFGPHAADLLAEGLLVLFVLFIAVLLGAVIWIKVKEVRAPYVPPDVKS